MALAANALTTVEAVKTYMGITSSTDDSLIETLVNNVSDQIENWCDRKLVSQTFSEYIDARGTRSLLVENPPIVSVDLIAYGARDSMSVSSSDSTDLLATVAVEESQIRLVRTASDGSTTTTNWAFASNLTTSLLVTRINSTTGFSATLNYNAPSYTLHRMGGRNVVDATAQLTVTSDDENEYRVDYDRGLIHLRADAFPRFAEKRFTNRFPDAFQSVYVRYVGGYSTIPNGLVQAAFELISDAFRGRDRDRNISGEGVGDYNYSLRPMAEWHASILNLLAPYRRVR